MDLPAPLAWLVDEASASAGPDRFLAELGNRLKADGLPLAAGSLALAVPHPIVARRSWAWRAESGAVIEALGFTDAPLSQIAHDALNGFSSVELHAIGENGAALAWAGARDFTRDESLRLREAARFAAAPLAALASRAAMAALLEAYLGRRSAARVQAGALRRGSGETILAALLFADLRGFTAMSETTEPVEVIAALDAWFDRLAGAVHAFGGEVLKFIGDGVLAIFPVTATRREACEAALRAIAAARAGMAHLDGQREQQGLCALPFGIALHVGEILWGNIGAADRLDFTAIGPAVNLVSRLEGLCRPLGRAVLISGAVAAEVATPLEPLGRHELRGIASPCEVFTLPD